MERENKLIEQQIDIEEQKKLQQENLIANWEKDQQKAAEDKRSFQEKVESCNA